MHKSSSAGALTALTVNLVFLAEVSERGTFLAASAELGVTPSTLSRAMRRMERDLGLELFVPAGRGLQLTPAGSELATRAQNILLQLKEGLRVASLLSERKPILRVGLLRSLGSDYMPRMVHGFAPAHPNVQFAFREGSSQRLEELLLSHEIDLALVAPPLARADISTVELFEQRIDVVVASASPVASRPSIDLGSLSDESFILPETGYGSRSITDVLFERAGIRPKVILETDDMAMAVAMAATGIGIALTPPTPTMHTGAVRVPLNDTQARRTVAACHLTAIQLPDHCRHFLEHLTSEARQQPGRAEKSVGQPWTFG